MSQGEPCSRATLQNDGVGEGCFGDSSTSLRMTEGADGTSGASGAVGSRGDSIATLQNDRGGRKARVGRNVLTV